MCQRRVASGYCIKYMACTLDALNKLDSAIGNAKIQEEGLQTE